MANLSKEHILFPPQIQITPYQLSVKILKGSNLSEVNRFLSGTGTDFFVKLEYGSVNIPQTSTKPKDRNPKWNEELLVYLQVNCG